MRWELSGAEVRCPIETWPLHCIETLDVDLKRTKASESISQAVGVQPEWRRLRVPRSIALNATRSEYIRSVQMASVRIRFKGLGVQAE